LLLAAVVWAVFFITLMEILALMAETHHSLALPPQVAAMAVVRLTEVPQTVALAAQVVVVKVNLLFLLLAAHLRL
jgi:hypothetical protein